MSRLPVVTTGLVALLLTACGAGPPPSPDMRAFLAQRQAPDAASVEAEQPDLAAAAERAYARAAEAHADGDVPRRVHEVHLADLLWRTAVARRDELVLQTQLNARVAAMRDVETEQVTVETEIASLREALDLDRVRAAAGPAVSSRTGAMSGQVNGRSTSAIEPVRPIPAADPDAEARQLVALAVGLERLGPVTINEQGIWLRANGLVIGTTDHRPQLDPDAADLLARTAQSLDGFRVTIEAYVDASGDPTTDLAWSQNVALAMRQALAERGVDDRRLGSIGRGAGLPDGDLPPERIEIRFEPRP